MDNCEEIPPWQKTGFAREIVEMYVALKKRKRKKNDRKKKRKRMQIEELDDEEMTFDD